MKGISWAELPHTIVKKSEFFGAWVAVLFCFSSSVLGMSAITVTSLIAIVLWFISLRCTEYVSTLKRYPFALVALILFLYLGVSLLWSEHPSDGLKLWKKYREFIFIPIFLIYFSDRQYQRYGVIALYSGMVLSLIISYLVYFDLFPLKSRQHSISNHIFNGILTSYFAYWSLFLAVYYKKYRYICIALFVASCFTLFYIRDGRTGHVLFFSLMLLFIFQHWRWKGLIVIASFGLLAAFIVSAPLSILFSTINDAFNEADLSYFSQLDIRLEFYINTLRIIVDNWWLGVGVGDYPALYLETSLAYDHFWEPAVNAHNEYLMIMVNAGAIGLALFMAFLIYLFKASLRMPRMQSQQAVSVVMTIIVSCLFNSSFKDAQDGALFLLLITLFFQHSLTKDYS